MASAIAMHYSNYIEDNVINIKTQGGMLTVGFENLTVFTEIYG